MRTLEEMQSDLAQIETNLETIATIASLAREFNRYDLATWNALIPATAERIDNLCQNLNEASESVGNYVKSLTVKVRSHECPASKTQSELNRAMDISQTLVDFAEKLDNQVAIFNAYQRQVLNRQDRH